MKDKNLTSYLPQGKDKTETSSFYKVAVLQVFVNRKKEVCNENLSLVWIILILEYFFFTRIKKQRTGHWDLKI
jgi:hypothetical protein